MSSIPSVPVDMVDAVRVIEGDVDNAMVLTGNCRANFKANSLVLYNRPELQSAMDPRK